MRNLASIQKVVSIQPIPEADAIEKVTVLGWECVIAKKDNFKVGDLVIYIEVDSIVPDKPEFEFLRQRKFRIRTIRLKKQISQGLVLPLTYLPPGSYSEGDDVTSVLGIKKYDPEGELEQKLLDEKLQRSNNRVQRFLSRYPWYRKIFFRPKRGGFPKFIKKTDEDRIQLFPRICEEHKDDKFIVTEKVDGQSATYFLVKKSKFSFLWFKFGSEYEFGVCSRNLHLAKPDSSSYWTIAKQSDIERILKSIIGNHQFVVLQGEVLGTGIQGNKYKINGYTFYAFNLIIDGTNYSTLEMKTVLSGYGIRTVPLLDTNFSLKPAIPDMVNYAKGNSILSNCLREGIVCRNYEKNISFKVVNPEFLLKNEE